ncbi:MAG: M16 family metallopeptidase, partial [Kiritimatiellia bacterium]
ERLPIGKLDILQNFEFERLRDFYRDWYRPDLMSVVVVGDVEAAQMEEWVKRYFADIQMPANPPERKVYAHPPHADTKVGTFSDPELTDAQVALLWKMPPRPVRTASEYREDIKAGLAVDMLNQRLFEQSQKAPSPFLQAQAYQGSYTRGGDVFLLYAGVKDESGAYLEAARNLLMEAERAKRFGFTEGELARASARRLRRMETAFAERDNTESEVLAAEMVRHALTGEYLPGIEKELEMHRELLAEVELEAVQSVFESWITGENRVVMATGPSKDGQVNLPAETALLELFDEVQAMEISPYEDGDADRPLLESEPEPGQIVEKSVREDLGLIYYRLSNGVEVTLKVTDFKEDEILLKGWRGGGMNMAPDSDWISARLSGLVASATGMGAFSVVELQKKLAGKLVGLDAGFSMDQDTVNGSASPQDLETLLQLLHLRMTTVRTDADAFAALQSRLRENVRNRLSDPREEFSELVESTLNLYHPRLRPLTLEEVDALNMEEALSFFHERFRNSFGFHFLFTGNIDEQNFEPLLEKWVASLPAEETEVKPHFLDEGFPQYILRRDMRKGLEPISQVQMVWTQDDFHWDYASRHSVQSMVAALRIRLREVVREEEGGTYHVSVWSPLQHYPEPLAQVRIAFTCDPERTEDLIESIQNLLEEFSQEALEEEYAQKVRESQLRRREQDLKENSYWNYVIPFYDWHGEDPSIILEFEQYVNGVTPESILNTAADFFATPHQAVFVLHPAEDSVLPGPDSP